MKTIVIAERRISYKTTRRHKVDIDFEGQVDNPGRAKALFKLLLENEPYEALYCLALDSSNHWLGLYLIDSGTVDRAPVHPRKLLSFLLIDTNATAIILCHNHPGGACKASSEDIALTRKLKGMLEPLNVRVLDHLIYASSNRGTEPGWFSLREEGLMS